MNAFDWHLEPGYYSVFVLSDDGTWSQPIYSIEGTAWTEHALEAMALNLGGRKAFAAYGVNEDPDAPTEQAGDIEDLGVAP
jgi:hypothetical protein